MSPSSIARIVQVSHYTGEGREVHGGEAGQVMSVVFELNGTPFSALNGGPLFKFNEAISLQVMCDSQEGIDRLWSRLSAGGDDKAQQCGWLKDRFGLSWQVVPADLQAWLGDPDPAKAGRAMKVFLKMKKIDLAKLKRAWAGTG